MKLENQYAAIHSNIDFLEKKIETYKRDMESSKLEYEKPFEHEEELRNKIKRQNEINVELDLENKDKKLFVPMPEFKSKEKDKSGKVIYQDVCYTVTKEFREKSM